MDNILGMPKITTELELPRAIVSVQAELITKQDVLIKYYESQILLMKRRQFGVSSEKTDVGFSQLTLFGDASKVPEPATEEIAYKRKKRVGKREEDLSGLPVERVDYELSEEERVCPECGEILRDIGVDVRRELKLIPAKVVVLEHAAHTYACKGCQKNAEMTPIVKAESPKPLLSGSLASPSHAVCLKGKLAFGHFCVRAKALGWRTLSCKNIQTVCLCIALKRAFSMTALL